MTNLFRAIANPLAAFAVLLAAGCSSTFEVSYDAPIDPTVSRSWAVADVRVTAPKSLSVSEEPTIFPKADIVWREDPVGDRRPQVEKIIRDAALQAVAPLQGSREVTLNITVTKFHALTYQAEERLTRSGVHNIGFTASIVDIATGTVLVEPTLIHSDLPAFVGQNAREQRRNGVTQKSFISGNIKRTIEGWLGIGPDPRLTFQRLGG